MTFHSLPLPLPDPLPELHNNFALWPRSTVFLVNLQREEWQSTTAWWMDWAVRWRPSSWGISSAGFMTWEYPNMNSESRPLFVYVGLMISKVEYKLFKFRRSLHCELYKLIMKLYLTWSMMLIFWHIIMWKSKTVFGFCMTKNPCQLCVIDS